MSVYALRQVFVTLISLLFALSIAPGGLYAAPARQASVAPEVSAKAAIVVEYPSGRILFQKNAHARLAMASTTKIMTAILALENGKLGDKITFSAGDATWGTSMGLKVGEQQTLQNLLYGLMLPSGNDAATAIARYIGSRPQLQARGSPVRSGNPVQSFVALMNLRARQLGLKDTHFINPHGLDAAGHYSSAYDLASMTWQALHIQTFNDVIKQPDYVVPGHALHNLNKMLALYWGADGGKTGLTDAAGLCLMTTATRNGHRLISVVLNAPRWTDDSTALLNYGFATLPAAAAKAKGVEVLSITTLQSAGKAPKQSAIK